MKRFTLFALLCVLAGPCLLAQTPPSGFVVFKGTKVTDVTGAPATGQLCAQVTSNGMVSSPNTKAYSVEPSGGGATTKPPVCTNINAGAFSMFLPDTNAANPRNACIALNATDNVTGDTLLDIGYGCVQPTSAASAWCSTSGGYTTCNLDLYHPNLPALGTVVTGPTGAQGIQGLVGPIGPSAVGYYDESIPWAGSTLAARLGNWDAALLGIPATINISHAQDLDADITLSAGHVVHAMASLGWNHKITLGDRSGVWCDQNVQHTTLTTSPYLVEFAASTDAFVDGCNVMVPDSVIRAYFVHSAGAVSMHVKHNKLSYLGIARLDGATSPDFDDNRAAHGYGLDMYQTDGGTVDHTSVSDTPNEYGAIQLFNGDADGDHYCGGSPLGTVINGAPCTVLGYLNFPASVTLGHMLITNTHASHTRFAVFTSMSTNVTVVGVDGDNLFDTGLDPEGGVNTLFANFNLHDCNGNWCASTFFESLNVKFNGGILSRADGGSIVRLKHTDPNYVGSNTNLTFENVTFDCGPVICPGVTLENQGQAIILNSDTFHNAIINPIDRYMGTLSIINPTMTFDASTSTAYTAIAPPNLINGSKVIVRGGTITATVTPPDGSIGIFFQHTDFNAVDFYIADGVTITGFPIALKYSGDSTNIGAGFYIRDLYYTGSLTQGGGNINRLNVTNNCNLSLASSSGNVCP